MKTDALPVRLPGAKADTLMWARVEGVEQQALDQLRNISRLPWVHGLRVMPDVHLGKGATVGSVVAIVLTRTSSRSSRPRPTSSRSLPGSPR